MPSNAKSRIRRERPLCTYRCLALRSGASAWRFVVVRCLALRRSGHRGWTLGGRPLRAAPHGGNIGPRVESSDGGRVAPLVRGDASGRAGRACGGKALGQSSPALVGGTLARSGTWKLQRTDWSNSSRSAVTLTPLGSRWPVSRRASKGVLLRRRAGRVAWAAALYLSISSTSANDRQPCEPTAHRGAKTQNTFRRRCTGPQHVPRHATDGGEDGLNEHRALGGAHLEMRNAKGK